MDNETVVAFVEERIGYTFKNKEYLLEALTHSSYTNEMKINKRPDYERLEFLGDAVLELISSEYLYELYPKAPEGGLSKKRASLVCEQSLSICARHMELGKAMFMGKGEDSTGGRERDAVLCDVTESVLGAIYLDGGLEPSREYVQKHILSDLEENQLFVDSKSTLQELVQRDFPLTELEYRLEKEEGPEHDKEFTFAVYLSGEFISEGSGKTKKSAQQMAAMEAVKILKNRNKN